MAPPAAGCSRGGDHEWSYDGATAGWTDGDGQPYTWISYTCKKCKTSHGERRYPPPKVVARVETDAVGEPAAVPRQPRRRTRPKQS